MKHILFILVILYTTFLQGKPLEKITLQLNWKHQFEFAGFYAAQEKGFYKEAGFDVRFQEYKNEIDVIQDVIDGKSDYGIAYSNVLLQYLEGKPITLLANFLKHSPLAIITHKDIKTPKDLVNKKIMGLDKTIKHAAINIILHRYGITPKDIINIPENFNMEDFIAKKIDAKIIYTTNETHLLDKMQIPYNLFSPKNFGTEFYDLNLFTSNKTIEKDAKKTTLFTQATIKGWEYALTHKEEIINLILKKYNTQNKTKESLFYEANSIEQLMLPSVYPIGSIDTNRLKSMAETFIELGYLPKNTPVDFNNFISKTKLNNFLSKEEKTYLLGKKEITMCIDPNWMPFEKFDKNGDYIGMSADYYKLFEKSLDTKFKVIPTKKWSDSLRYAKERKCDILSLVMETKKRKEYLNFTQAYLKIPLVIATKPDVPFVNDIKDILHHKIAIPKGYAFVEILKQKYPNINIVEVKDIDEGLDLVNNGSLFAYIGTLASIGYKFQTKYSGELKIAGKLSNKWELGIGVRNDDPILLEILKKAIHNVTLDQERTILNKWISIKYEKGIDYTLVWQIILLFIVIFSIVIYFYLKQRQLKNEFETIFKNTKDGIAILDFQSRFINCNDEYLKMTGFTKEELLNKSCIELTVSDDIQKSKKILQKVIKEGYVQNFEKICLVKDGSHIVVNMSLSLMPDKKKILISTKDVTQIKKLEEQSKLASMGEMIGNIAHQWRQPLSVISTIASGMIMKTEADIKLSKEEILKACDNITETALYLSQTIDDFRDYIKGDSQPVRFNLKTHTTSFNKLIDSVVKDHNIHIILELEEDVHLDGYPNELKQCFINIFNNAKDAMLENNIPIDERFIFISQKVHKDTITIQFKDNAGGIPPNIIDKVFEPYFTTKHKSQGTGLGLHMTYKLITTSMGGTIEVENITYEFNKKLYGGALFTITLPLRINNS